MKISLLFVLFMTMLCSCTQLKRNACIGDFQSTFSQVQSESKIDFQRMDCFPWDSLMLLASYHYCGQILEETGVVLPENLSSNDPEVGYLVFLQRNQVQKIIRIKKDQLNLSSYIQANAYSSSFLILDRQKCDALTFKN
ncbi:hypothetical protein [Sphingobacterium cellulitidis]|uniref:hypothetical protein n=1 Tax=Sphingobacterium cellulitidis TaxID=1768011 RepID=UPI003C7BC0C9